MKLYPPPLLLRRGQELQEQRLELGHTCLSPLLFTISTSYYGRGPSRLV